MKAPPLTPLDTLYEEEQDSDLPLPGELASLYGRLQFPAHPGRPYIIANFVASLDGVVSLNDSKQSGGGEISGNNRHDRMVMGLLRAVAGAVIIGAGTQRAAPRHLWTAEYIFPSLADAYQQLRAALGKSEPPLNVIVTAQGNVNLDLPVFQSGKVPALIVTSTEGEQRIRERSLPPHLQVQAVESNQRLSAQAILAIVNRVRPDDTILVEGGAQLLGDFFAERCLDELFLTLAPQIAGRDASVERPGLVMGKLFAPEHPLWGKLASVKRAGDHLFLRYRFAQTT